jgi:MoaA/NifB/PqqE/SkfB family radical SAM enzyme|tara:strand:- start:3 stop:1154 length:1152 start_codon:yes stop_codon:yes gene_type:complete
MKKYFKNKSLCPLPFAGLYIEPSGDVKCCSISKQTLGNIHTQSIEDLINGETVKSIRRDMLEEKFPSNCNECYEKERNFKSINFNQISNRLYHIGKLGTAPIKLYEDENNFELQQLDVRWRNTCNGACVYCGPELSSRWAIELNDTKRMTKQAMSNSIEYVYDHIDTVKTLYLCGGEPMMMKENVKLVKIIAETRPELDIRINTNLSNLNNPVYETIKDLPNIHWILSAEASEDRFEYIRYPLSWTNFINNFKVIKKLPHKISMNMSWNILNSFGIFEFIDLMIENGLHENSFVINPVLDPKYYNILNLPQEAINVIKKEATKRHGRLHDPFMLKYSYEAIIKHCNKPIMHKQQELKQQLEMLDARRSLDSKKVFPELYERLF